MPNHENIKGQGFHTNPERINKNGHPKGIRNRSTIAKAILQMKLKLPVDVMQTIQKDFPEITDRMTIEDIMTIIQVREAIVKGNTNAYKAVMDSAYGQPTQGINFESEKEQLTEIRLIVIDPSNARLNSESEKEAV
jgi:hypothetical protein